MSEFDQGYSYGALVASTLPVPLTAGLRTTYVLLSYPLGPRHWLTAFRGKTFDNMLRELVSGALA